MAGLPSSRSRVRDPAGPLGRTQAVHADCFIKAGRVTGSHVKDPWGLIDKSSREAVLQELGTAK